MTKRIAVLISFLCLPMSGTVVKKEAHIVQINGLQIIVASDILSIDNQLANISDSDTLVIFDCDDVLSTADIPVFRQKLDTTGKLTNDFTLNILEEIPNVSEEKVLALSQSVLAGTTPVLVNKRMPAIVAGLQARGVPCIVLTAFPPTPVPGMPDAVGWRVCNLKRLGFDFNRSWPAFMNTGLPVFSGGVLFSGALPKDKSLRIFLSHMQMRPKRIVFIDDSLRNVIRVGEYCRSAGLKFTGIHYTEAATHPSAYSSALGRSRFQMQVLIRHGVWLPENILPERDFKLDWVALCNSAIMNKNIYCVELLLDKIEHTDVARLSSHFIRLAEQTKDYGVIACVAKRCKSGGRIR
jgi:hypothetical protein